MRETMQFDSIYSFTLLIISIVAFPLSSSFEFIYFSLQMAPLTSISFH